MLLSEAEWFAAIEKISPLDGETVSAHTLEQISRAIEAAILAKLGAMELPPLPAYEYGPHTGHVTMRPDESLKDWGKACYEQGAAAQLSEKPSGYLSQYNLEMLQQGYPQTIVMLEGAKRDVPLYTRREAK